MMHRSKLTPLIFVATTLGGCLTTAWLPVADAATPATARVDSPATDEAIAAPISQRFAQDATDEVPDFQKHVVPLLGRLGCNGRACHGSFQGRGGFQLSLFGYDFKADHEAMLDEASGRVDVDDVDESLILSKPTDADMHEGGKRYSLGSWQHHVLRRWIQAGAQYEENGTQKLQRLVVTPAEIQFDSDRSNVQLKVVARWEDGSLEDVTELCRFSSNDDAVAAIDETGRVESGDRGDTHVVVYYDNAVVPVPVMRPIGPRKTPHQEPATQIDQLIQAKLDKLGIEPSGICTDAEFIRRVSLDMTGLLPEADEVRAFLADDAPDKRQRLVERLLDSPAYAAWWATRFSDWTGNNEEQLNNLLPVRNAASRLWYEWLRARLEQNAPYDEIVEGIVTAQSRDKNESYQQFCESMSQACQPGNEELFAQRESMPLYWGRRNFQQPEERAIGFAYTFLGVRIECAQCHKHPFDQWSKDDFEEFAKLFQPVRFNQNTVTPDSRQAREELLASLGVDKDLRGGELRRKISQLVRDGESVPFGELLVNTRSVSPQQLRARRRAKAQGRNVPPLRIPSGKILGVEQPVSLDKDPREQLMDWLRSPENPYFAKAIVNRVWSNYFGAGIVDPTDDMNLANPPVNAPLLDHLATQFIANDFDLRWLHRTIVSSDTYQRSSDTNATNVDDRTNFSRHVPRRLPAEVVYDAVVLATGSDQYAGKLRDELDQMAIAEGQPRRRNQANFALQVFGQSVRESNCDCDRSDAPSLLQSIYLRNDAEMHRRLTAQNGWVAQACEAMGVAGPRGSSDPRQLANERRADATRKQLINQVRQFKRQPAQRQERLRPQLETRYQRLAELFKGFGYEIPDLDQLIEQPGAWSTLEPAGDQAVETQSVEKLVVEAYLRTLSRYPESEETQIAVDYINQSETPADGVQSLLWALVNTKEFIITH